MADFFGRSDALLLFTDGDKGVIVDSAVGLIVASGYADLLQPTKSWGAGEFSATDEDLATVALSALDTSLVASASKMYTIPRGVQNEAKKALQWHAEANSGSPSALRTARMLASGGQVTSKTLRHIAKYFPRHADQFNGEGWTSSTPSSARVSWGLWGGDAAQKWASAIVDRENSTALTADGFGLADYTYETSETAPVVADFEKSMADEPEAAEFIARVRLDGSGIDRIYKIEPDSRVYVWDNGTWDDLGEGHHDIWTYDTELDTPYDKVEKTHVVIDPDAAVIVAAKLYKEPNVFVSIEEIDAAEFHMAREAIPEIDWVVIDYALTAAGAPGEGDGVYTPDERKANAGKQVRDKDGKFATVGSRVSVNGDKTMTGNITRVDPASGNVTVKLESDGSSIVVPGKQVEGVAAVSATSPGVPIAEVPKVDTSGILGEPRTPINRAKATIPGTLPAMDKDAIHSMLNDWPAFVKSQRDAYIPTGASGPVSVQAKDSTDVGAYGRALEKTANKKLSIDAYEHPLLKEWLKKVNGKTPNAIWYNPITAAVAPGEKPKELTPDTSDVQPVYLAVVAPDDPRAVLNLVSLLPASSTSTTPMTYVRDAGKWVRDPSVLSDLNSATPPPIIPLDSDTLNDVLKQVDTSQEMTASAIPMDLALMVLFGPDTRALVAAGHSNGVGRGAAKLKKYWTVGKGGAKIRWGTGGDWTRCVRHLSKHLGPRAKGYCALRHHEMTGMWTGDQKHMQARGMLSDSSVFIKPRDEASEAAALTARANDARTRMRSMVAGAAPVVEQGGRFRIPLVIPEEIESGDGRKFQKDSITLRDFPLPLLWQIKTADGHAGSPIVGRIDSMERVEGGIGNAVGVFDTGEFGKEAERLIRAGFLRHVSADMDRFEAQEEHSDEAAAEGEIKSDKLSISAARVMAVTLVSKPAFQECGIFLAEDESPEEDDMASAESPDPIAAAALVACGFVAGAIPVTPPTEWFGNPKLKGATPLTVDDTGRVFGHIAAWQMDHIGYAFGSNTKPPRSKSNYAYFHSGVVRTTDGTDITVGQLTLAGGHAGMEADALEAAAHYDNTASAVADVHAGEDSYGIWVAGALRPGATPEQIRALRASAPSGDWRPVRGSRGLELVAVCQVNVPGFPIARARVASGGQVMALVAAGALPLAKIKEAQSPEHVMRLEKLEQFSIEELSTEARTLASRISTARDERNAHLAARSEALSARVREASNFAFIPHKERVADREASLTASALRARIEAVSIVAASAPKPKTDEDGVAVAPTVDKVGEIDVVADTSTPAPSDAVGTRVTPYTPDTQPRDDSGKFRLVLAQLKDNLGAGGNQRILDKIQETENLDNTGDYKAAVESAADLVSTIDRLDTGALNATSIGNVRKATKDLSTVIANLPLPFGKDAEKLRFSDLPPALRQLANNLVDRVIEKLGAKDGGEATRELKSFMSGSELYSQSDISSQMNTMLRLLT